MDWTTILISILVALITAIVTTSLNLLLWKIQFDSSQKAEYRKLYHSRRLKVYEELASLLTFKGAKIMTIIYKGSHEYNTALYEETGNIMDAVFNYKMTNYLYFTSALADKLTIFSDTLYQIKLELLKKQLLNENIADGMMNQLALIQSQMLKDLGIGEILDSKDMKKMLRSKIERPFAV